MKPKDAPYCASRLTDETKEAVSVVRSRGGRAIIDVVSVDRSQFVFRDSATIFPFKEAKKTALCERLANIRYIRVLVLLGVPRGPELDEAPFVDQQNGENLEARSVRGHAL